LDRPENLPDDEAKLLMNDPFKRNVNLPPEQEAIRAKCFHPTGKFVEFPQEEIEQSIPERFEKIVRAYPDRIAVKSKGGALTYKALNQTANRIARLILEQSGDTEKPVALLLDKDARALAAILGVLKAGKMYLVLDPWFPGERVTFMLNDSRADLLVSDSKNLTLAAALARDQQKSLNLDAVESNHSSENVGVPILPDAFAYIRYTSGSVGQPKGVLENHRNMLHNVMNVTNALHICADDRVTLLGSLSTGQAATDMYAALLNGAALYPWDIKQEGLAGLAKWIAEEKITLYRSSATAFRAFIDTLSAEERFPRLRIIRLGSEPVLWKDIESYREHFSQDCVVVNALSLGEARTVCLIVVNRETPISGNSVPVGYALADKQVLIFDDAGNQLGFNEIGEIAVRSRYLSPGYWHRPDLTQAKFLPDPDGADRRICLTGDLGRMMPDGCLEHIGRKDFQIKVRGYRVEVGEIEAILLAQSNVREAVVATRKAAAGADNERLVAYIAPCEKPSPSVSVLRRAIRDKLPDYMVPSDFVFLDTLPLTPNGKLDRRSLPDPGNSRPDLDIPFFAPRTSVEKQLAQIWAEVLSLDQVGLHDNFFDLGGHSLAATRVVSQVIKQFRLEVPLQALFQAPTVAEMSAVIDERQKNRLTEEELERILTELEAMSEEEAKKLGGDR
jgi:amino acid adenylation domain-containing protein